MAVNAGKSKNPFYTLTAEERAKISMPDRFKCRQCNVFKAPADFSNKEIKDYQFKKVAMPHINGVTAKLRCRPCAGEQVHELQCEGPCGETKPLDCFSKAQRTRGMKWCQECVLWKEGTEPGAITGAAPGADLAPDEKYNDGWGYNSDPEIGSCSGSDSEDGSNFAYQPYEGMAGLKISDKIGKVGSAANTHNSAAVASTSMQSIPRLQNRSAGKSGRVSSGATTGSQSGYVPPHIRALTKESSSGPASQPRSAQSAVGKLIDVDDAKTVSSASNPYEDAWSSTGTLGPWSAVDTRRRNALYEPHRALDEPTCSVAGPVPGPSPAYSQPISKRGWARPVIARRAPAPQPVAAPTRRHQAAYDSDGSPDEM